MSRRIDIELTSQMADGSWTWRAAGARQPKGTVAADLVPSGEAVGAVLRADVEIGLEGIEILSLSTAKPARSPEKTEGRIEVKGTPRRAPDVSVILAPGSDKRRRDRDDDGGARRGGRRGPDGEGRRDDREGDRPARGGGGGPRRPGGRRPGEGDGRPARGERPVAPTSTVHRNAMLAALRPEQIPVAEQLLRGGLQAVRQAIETQNASNKAAGKPPVSSDALLGMADELLPAVRLADWKDRASVAQTAGKDYRLRELRAVVAASRTVNLDEEGRAMAKGLQESLDQRTTALREEWLARITNALNDGRVLQAVEASIRPPEPGTRCPAELAVRLASAAGEAMRADLAPEDWMRLLDAVVASPVRRTVKPAGIPDDEVAKQAARNAAGAVPALASCWGSASRRPHPGVSTPSADSVQPAAERQQASGEPRRLQSLFGGAIPRQGEGIDAVTAVLGAPGDGCLHQGRAHANAPGAGLHVATLDQAARAAPWGVRNRGAKESDDGAFELPHQQTGLRSLRPMLQEGDGGGLSDEGGTTPHGLGGHQGLRKQAGADLAVLRSGRSGQLHAARSQACRSSARRAAGRPG
jgi:hypothetical protein